MESLKWAKKFIGMCLLCQLKSSDFYLVLNHAQIISGAKLQNVG